MKAITHAHGTLHVLLVTKRRVVVSADALMVVGAENTVIAEDCQKFWACGEQTIAGVAGTIQIEANWHGIPQKPFDGEAIAGICSIPELRYRPREVLSRIAAAAREPMLRMLKMGECRDVDLFQAYAIRRSPDGIDFIQSRFPLTTMAGGKQVLGEAEFIWPFGRESYVPEKMVVPTIGYPVRLGAQFDADSLGDSALLRKVDEIFELARKQNPKDARAIGDPTHVAVIEQEGIRWLRKKPASIPEKRRAHGLSFWLRVAGPLVVAAAALKYLFSVLSK